MNDNIENKNHEDELLSKPHLKLTFYTTLEAGDKNGEYHSLGSCKFGGICPGDDPDMLSALTFFKDTVQANNKNLSEVFLVAYLSVIMEKVGEHVFEHGDVPDGYKKMHRVLGMSDNVDQLLKQIFEVHHRTD